MKKLIFILLLILLTLNLFAGNRNDGWKPSNFKQELNDTIKFNASIITQSGDTIDDIGTGSVSAQDIIDSIASALNKLDSIVFNKTNGGIWLEGKLRYDTTYHFLTFGMSASGVQLQIGGEFYIYARNTSGSTIINGKYVRFTGVTGEVPNVDIAGCGSLDSSYVIGAATHDIPNNEFGFITMIGAVNDVNTSGAVAGQLEYLSHNGETQSTKPTYPFITTIVGTVLKVNASTGIRYVDIVRTPWNIPEKSIYYSGVNRQRAGDSLFIYNDTTDLLTVHKVQLDSINELPVDSFLNKAGSGIACDSSWQTVTADTGSFTILVIGTDTITGVEEITELPYPDLIDSLISNGLVDSLENEGISGGSDLTADNIRDSIATLDTINVSGILSFNNFFLYQLNDSLIVKNKTTGYIQRIDSVIGGSTSPDETAPYIVNALTISDTVIALIPSEALNTDSIPDFERDSIYHKIAHGADTIYTDSVWLSAAADTMFWLTSTLSGDSTIYVYYIQADSARWQDDSGNLLASLSDTLVTNNISTIPTEGLLAYWPFDGNADDYSGNGYDLSVTGAILDSTNRDGVINKCYYYDGNNDYMTISDTVVGIGSKSINFWIRLSEHKNWNMIFRNAVGLSAANEGMECYTNSTGYITVNVGNGGEAGQFMTVTSNSTLNLFDWTMISIIQYDNDSLSLLIDGVWDVSDQAPTGTEASPTVNFFIGERQSNYYLHGRLDDIRIYTRELSTNELNALKNE